MILKSFNQRLFSPLSRLTPMPTTFNVYAHA